jgi:CheY-like chemotaxis protein
MSLTALITEDNPAYQVIMRTALEFAGYDVEVASNGSEAIQLLAKRTFHALFLDLNMPVMDGLTCLRIIRSMNSYNQMHIIVVTANSHMAKSSEIETLADFLMMKPLNVEELATFAERLKHTSRVYATT